MEKAILEIVDMYKQVNELRERFENEFGVLNIRVDHSIKPTYEVGIQYDKRDFFNKFSNFEITKKENEFFPYTVFFIDENVTHFALLSEFEYKKYVLKEAK